MRGAVLQILGCTKALKIWGGAPDGPATLHDIIVSDTSIIKACSIKCMCCKVHSLHVQLTPCGRAGRAWLEWRC